ncbi:MAG: alkaline phosphatase family protein [Myxococcales bacterium]|nr:alkaline phosphatase family protein [Myxococcales bacterium]
MGSTGRGSRRSGTGRTGRSATTRRRRGGTPTGGPSSGSFRTIDGNDNANFLYRVSGVVSAGAEGNEVTRMTRFALSTVAVVSLFAALNASAAPPGAKKPKLVVVVVIDQLRASDLQRLGAHLDGGFKRLLAGGAVLDGHYGHQNTYTGPGHALILSGSYGYLNGITQNKWFNRATNQSEGMLYDANAKPLVGVAEPSDDTSPRNFIGSTVGDELRLASGGAAKSVAVALKERGALLLGGRIGQAYFFSEAAGEMTSSNYYMAKLPDWADSFNARKLPEQAFGKSWERALPVGAYVLSGVDDNPWEGDQLGLKRTFPHPINGGVAKPGPKFYEAFTMSPFGIDYQFAFAQGAVEGEKLGARGVTDLLAISVSSTDLIGHNFGVYSHESEDALVRTDRALGAFLGWLDGKLGKDGYLTVLTADHGAAMPPEQAAKLGLGGARVKKAQIKAAIGAALDARFGTKGADWVLALEDPCIYLNTKLIAERKLDRAEVEQVAGEALVALPGFAGYFTRTQIERGWMPQTAAARAVTRSFHRGRSGDVVAVQAPFSYWGKYGEKEFGGSHGSFYRYDTDVPLVLAGAPFRAGYHGQAEMVDLAATLARVLGVAVPAGCEGEPLVRVLK